MKKIVSLLTVTLFFNSTVHGSVSATNSNFASSALVQSVLFADEQKNVSLSQMADLALEHESNEANVAFLKKIKTKFKDTNVDYKIINLYDGTYLFESKKMSVELDLNNFDQYIKINGQRIENPRRIGYESFHNQIIKIFAQEKTASLIHDHLFAKAHALGPVATFTAITLGVAIGTSLTMLFVLAATGLGGYKLFKEGSKKAKESIDKLKQLCEKDKLSNKSYEESDVKSELENINEELSEDKKNTYFKKFDINFKDKCAENLKKSDEEKTKVQARLKNLCNNLQRTNDCIEGLKKNKKAKEESAKEAKKGDESQLLKTEDNETSAPARAVQSE